MSIDLYLKNPTSTIDKNLFEKTLAEIEEESEGVKFQKLDGDSWNVLFWSEEMCGIDYIKDFNPKDSESYGQIYISTNRKLYPYAEYIATQLAKKLKLEIFDPQDMKNIDVSSISIDLSDIKKKHQKIFKESETYEIWLSEPIKLGYIFFLDRVFNYILSKLNYKEGCKFSAVAFKDSDTEVNSLKFHSEIVELYLFSPKNEPDKVQIKITLKNQSRAQEIEEIVNGFAKSSPYVGFANEQEIIFKKSTEPRPS